LTASEIKSSFGGGGAAGTTTLTATTNSTPTFGGGVVRNVKSSFYIQPFFLNMASIVIDMPNIRRIIIQNP
jgi:hypothetical protein